MIVCVVCLTERRAAIFIFADTVWPGRETCLISCVIFMQIKLNRGVRNILCETLSGTLTRTISDEHTLITGVECRIQNNYQQIDDWMRKTSFCKERLSFEHFGNATQNDARNRLHPFSGVRHVVSLEIPSIEQDRQKWQRRQRLVCSCYFISSPFLVTGDKWSKIRILHCRLTGRPGRTGCFNYC